MSSPARSKVRNVILSFVSIEHESFAGQVQAAVVVASGSRRTYSFQVVCRPPLGFHDVGCCRILFEQRHAEKSGPESGLL